MILPLIPLIPTIADVIERQATPETIAGHAVPASEPWGSAGIEPITTLGDWKVPTGEGVHLGYNPDTKHLGIYVDGKSEPVRDLGAVPLAGIPLPGADTTLNHLVVPQVAKAFAEESDKYSAEKAAQEASAKADDEANKKDDQKADDEAQKKEDQKADDEAQKKEDQKADDESTDEDQAALNEEVLSKQVNAEIDKVNRGEETVPQFAERVLELLGVGKGEPAQATTPDGHSSTTSAGGSSETEAAAAERAANLKKIADDLHMSDQEVTDLINGLSRVNADARNQVLQILDDYYASRIALGSDSNATTDTSNAANNATQLKQLATLVEQVQSMMTGGANTIGTNGTYGISPNTNYPGGGYGGGTPAIGYPGAGGGYGSAGGYDPMGGSAGGYDPMGGGTGGGMGGGGGSDAISGLLSQIPQILQNLLGGSGMGGGGMGGGGMSGGGMSGGDVGGGGMPFDPTTNSGMSGGNSSSPQLYDPTQPTANGGNEVSDTTVPPSTTTTPPAVTTPVTPETQSTPGGETPATGGDKSTTTETKDESTTEETKTEGTSTSSPNSATDQESTDQSGEGGEEKPADGSTEDTEKADTGEGLTVKFPDGSTVECATEAAATAIRNALEGGLPGDAATAAFEGTDIPAAGPDGSHGSVVDPSNVQPGDVAVLGEKTMIVAKPGFLIDDNGQLIAFDKALGDDSGFTEFRRWTDPAGAEVPELTDPTGSDTSDATIPAPPAPSVPGEDPDIQASSDDGTDAQAADGGAEVTTPAENSDQQI